MSTPRSLALPEGVEAATIETDRGPFAAHVVRGGSAGLVVLVPGWTGSKEDFTPILPLLATAGFDVVAYDQRGQYETFGADDADYSMSGFAADAVAVAQSTGSGPAHLLGHSFGGLVAQQAVVDAPATWASLSLLCTGPGALGQSPERQLDQVIAALEGGTPMEAVARALKPDLDDEPADIAQFVIDKFTKTSSVSLAAITALLRDTPDLTDQVATTGVRCWVGRGVDDESWPHHLQDDQAARLATTTHVIADSEHSPAIENPTGLVDAWLPFLTQD